ncbi:hypothetical protein L9F63_012764, partial [Diploptera punctata]
TNSQYNLQKLNTYKAIPAVIKQWTLDKMRKYFNIIIALRIHFQSDGIILLQSNESQKSSLKLYYILYPRSTNLWHYSSTDTCLRALCLHSLTTISFNLATKCHHQQKLAVQSLTFKLNVLQPSSPSLILKKAT